MLFKKFTAGLEMFGTDEQPPEEVKQEKNVCFHDQNLTEKLENLKNENHEHLDLERVLIHLAACHTIIYDEKNK